MNSGLWLLFLVFVGTIGFPPIVAVAFGTDMTSLWAMQGLFLIAILVVCGASYPIERFLYGEFDCACDRHRPGGGDHCSANACFLPICLWL